jgi:hypothetical protein
MSPGWSRNFSPETIKLLDYVEMDPQTIPNGNGYGGVLSVRPRKESPVYFSGK